MVCRLVDRRFFGFAADHYVRAHPPAGPCLFEYGATFPDFLARLPALRRTPVPGGRRAARMGDERRAPRGGRPGHRRRPRWRAVPPEDVGRLVFRTDPSASWLRSPLAGRPDLAGQPARRRPRGPVDLAAGGARLEIRRREDVVTLRRLEPAEFAFRAGLGAGATLETAADAALKRGPGLRSDGRRSGLCSERRSSSVQLERAEDGASPMTTGAPTGTAASPTPRSGSDRMARSAGRVPAVDSPAALPPRRRQRLPQGRPGQGVELGADGRPLPRRVPRAGAPPRAGGRRSRRPSSSAAPRCSSSAWAPVWPRCRFSG